MAALRFGLSLAGILLFAACAVVLILAFAAKTFALEGFSWIDPLLGGWLFGALLLVLLLRWTSIRHERQRRGG